MWQRKPEMTELSVCRVKSLSTSFWKTFRFLVTWFYYVFCLSIILYTSLKKEVRTTCNHHSNVSQTTVDPFLPAVVKISLFFRFAFVFFKCLCSLRWCIQLAQLSTQHSARDKPSNGCRGHQSSSRPSIYSSVQEGRGRWLRGSHRMTSSENPCACIWWKC